MKTLNRKAIKKEARAFIETDRRWLTMGLACLPIYLLTTALQSSGTSNSFADEESGIHFSISFGAGILTWLFIPFTIAITGYFLNYLRGYNPEWKSLYREGIDRYGKYFTVGVIKEIIIALWTLLFIIPGIIKSYEYFFVHYIIHDNPNLDQKQARELSKRITSGFKIDLFVLDLSFILWYVLEIISFGIASIYVQPYTSCTKAMCYENLKHHALVNGIATPDEFGIYPVQEDFNQDNNFMEDFFLEDIDNSNSEESTFDNDTNEQN